MKLSAESIAAAKERVDKGKVDYVSTNDVLTSELANMLQPILLEMAVDLRPHLEGLEENDAGMYVGNLFFASKEDYGTPEAIRLAVTEGRLRRAGHMLGDDNKQISALPGSCGICCGKLGFISNWSSFQVDMEWGEGCDQLLHFPIEKATPFDSGIVFGRYKDCLSYF